MAGSTWGAACLIAADFTGADFAGDSATFDGALFCGTIMPDGTRNDRDCALETGCCFGAQGGLQACTTVADCPDMMCQDKTCEANCEGCGRVCLYEAAFGPSPNALCSNHCCLGECCPTAAYVCDAGEGALDSCCLPSNPGDCEPFTA